MEKYLEADLEIVQFPAEDIIATSSQVSTDDDELPWVPAWSCLISKNQITEGTLSVHRLFHWEVERLMPRNPAAKHRERMRNWSYGRAPKQDPAVIICYG